MSVYEQYYSIKEKSGIRRGRSLQEANILASLFRIMKCRNPIESREYVGVQRIYTVKSVIRAATILKAFASSSEILELRVITKRSNLNKATAFRLSETLVEAGLLDRVGRHGYRLRVDMTLSRRYRIGYAAQSTMVPFTATVTDSLMAAASTANVDLLVLNNKFCAKTALLNADRFIAENVELVIDAQIDVAASGPIAAKFLDKKIPLIAIDSPHPGAFYFGADNYKAGLMAGRYLGKWALKNWKGEVNEIILIGIDIAGPPLKARLSGIHDGMLEACPHLRNVQSVYLDTKSQFEKTLDTMRKHLRKRKLRRVLVGAVNDISALAALQAFRDLGIEDECAVAGQGACIEAREEMRSDFTRLICSVAYFPERYGEQIIKLGLDILSRKSVSPAIFTQHELITSENVGKIYPNDSWINRTARPIG